MIDSQMYVPCASSTRQRHGEGPSAGRTGTGACSAAPARSARGATPAPARRGGLTRIGDHAGRLTRNTPGNVQGRTVASVPG